MKTALVFPGLDALFLASKFRRWIQIPVVADTLKEGSHYLSLLTGATEDLSGFLASNSRPHLRDFDRTLVALTALQIGITRGLQQTKQWDLLVGCSHGDIARSVISKSLGFQAAVQVLWAFSELRKTCPPGQTANVRAISGPLLPEHFDWLNSNGLSVSQWSDSHATGAGGTELLARLSQEAASMGLKVKPVLAYPVHSPSMQPSVDVLKRLAPQWPVRDPQAPLFSSVYVRYLKDAEDVKQEAFDGATSPIRWKETIETLAGPENVTTLLNVGPCNTLTGWILESPKLRHLQVVEAWDILGEPEVLNEATTC